VQEHLFDYGLKGEDWYLVDLPNGQKNYCDMKEHLSPINLLDPLGPSGWVYGRPIPAASDKHEKFLSNP